jgi:transcriptional regulator with XRE-family HTH domain
MRQADAASEGSLATNLRLAASFLPSVSQLCRDVGLNRQQVNKYLNGHSHPSPYNLRRIAAYLGVEPNELTLPTDRFAEIWRRRGAMPTAPADRLQIPEQFRAAFVRPEPAIDRFLGIYHCYINSYSWPGHVLRYVMALRRNGPWITTKSLGRYQAEPGTGERYRMKYAGVATMQANSLVIMEQQQIGAPTLSMTMLQPTYRSDVGLLCGICADTPVGGTRRPVASRIVLRFLGRKADIRAAIAQTAILPPDGPLIDLRIRQLLAEPLDAAAERV